MLSKRTFFPQVKSLALAKLSRLHSSNLSQTVWAQQYSKEENSWSFFPSKQYLKDFTALHSTARQWMQLVHAILPLASTICPQTIPQIHKNSHPCWVKEILAIPECWLLPARQGYCLSVTVRPATRKQMTRILEEKTCLPWSSISLFNV